MEDMIAEESEMGEADGIDSDMQLAAMALQNLSCSPASPHFPGITFHQQLQHITLPI